MSADVGRVPSLQERELSAFERGRMQGEMEAMRRVEAEGLHKQQIAAPIPAQAPIMAASPDVIEIMRLGWFQRLAWVAGQATGIAAIVLMGIWISDYRGGTTWTNEPGEVGTYNVGLITFMVGLFCHAQAISHYRVFPVHFSAAFNRLNYVFWQCAAMTCYTITMVSRTYSNPTGEEQFWSVSDWVFAAAYAIYGLHFLRSVIASLLPWRHHGAEKTGINKLFSTPEQKRDHSISHDGLRSLYAGAPEDVTHMRNKGPHGADNVQNRPGVRPARWSEVPHMYENNIFLMPRAKWGVIAFWAMGSALLMDIVARQVALTARRSYWPQGPFPLDGTGGQQVLTTDDTEQRIIGALSLLVMFTLMFISYMAWPPRTTIAKNALHKDTRLNDQALQQV